MRIIILLYCTLGSLLLFSCLDSDPIVLNSEVKIEKFYILGIDSAAYHFEIDHINKTITNQKTPLAYETDITSSQGILLCSSPQVYISSKDSVAESLTDTTIVYSTHVNFLTKADFTGEVLFKVNSQDMSQEEIYTVKVIVSDINPDEILMKETNSAIFSTSADCQSLVYFKDQFWFYQMDLASNNFQIASSSNGSTWTEHISSTAPSSSFVVKNLTDKLLLLEEDNIYLSSNGVDWELISAHNFNFEQGKMSPYAFSVNGELFLAGGELTSGHASTYVAKTQDGNTWQTLPASSAVQVKGAAHTVHNGKLYLIGGMLNGEIKGETYMSLGGESWHLLPNRAPAIYDATAISYDEKLWLFSGFTASGEANTTVWFSLDEGLNWEEDEDEEFVLPPNFKRGKVQNAINTDFELLLVGGYTLMPPASKTYHSNAYLGQANKYIE